MRGTLLAVLVLLGAVQATAVDRHLNKAQYLRADDEGGKAKAVKGELVL